MAESLRRLVNIGSFTILQEKLEKWFDDYHRNTCDQNVARGCEIIELNSRIQSQLFKLLNLCAAEGGAYGGASVIKSRLLPWLGQAALPYAGFVNDRAIDLITESAAKDREINQLSDMYERSLNTLEEDLTETKAEADDLKAELLETRDQLESIKRVSASDKMFTESDLRDLKSKLNSAEGEIHNLRGRANLVDNYERQIRRLQVDVDSLSGQRSALLNGDVEPPRSLLPLPRPSSPFAPEDVTQRVRQQNLITRFNDMFASDRLDALDILRRYSDDHENNQRIIFAVLQEAFTAAKLAFSKYKLKVRSSLAGSHVGPDTLEEAVQDYINRNVDLYDLPSLVSDVIRALNRNPKLVLPPEAPYSVIQPFVREACKMAWNMSALAYPLDISLATDAELYDDHKYRRSYDSDYTAPLVNHHIWPALMQGNRVVVKGEACTRRGASLNTPRRSRSPFRALSPSRSRSPSPRLRSRSASPRRLESSLSGRASPSSRVKFL